jgi:hypothetical protein
MLYHSAAIPRACHLVRFWTSRSYYTPYLLVRSSFLAVKEAGSSGETGAVTYSYRRVSLPIQHL